MESSQAFFDSYDAVELELPGGKTVRCKAIKLSDAARFLRLLQRAIAGDAGAMLEVMEEFPKAVELDPEVVEELLPGEFFDVVWGFFRFRRTATRNSASRPETTPTESPSDSTT